MSAEWRDRATAAFVGLLPVLLFLLAAFSDSWP